jgi:cysteinyl-tRNA synthetase
VLVLKNSYTKSLEPFEPLDPERVTLYSCGPTVYSFAHIGNFRSFLFADVLRRVLERRGFVVKHVMNVTDVGHMTVDHLADCAGEDKLSKAARELGTDPYTVARHYETLFVEDARALRIKNQLGAEGTDRSLHPRATAHVPEMLVMIQSLLDRGYAYVDGTGQVYFEVAKFPAYGDLSGKVLDELEVGARVAVREEKKDPRDFALWKVDEKHLMTWDPHGAEGWPAEDWERYRALAPNGVDRRIGKGFPGWHIECSAMARTHLGDVIDLHTGGEDNVFPHHECEIAQSHGAYGASTVAPKGAPDAGHTRPTFARYWVHGRHLLVDGHKMSKRDGTFFTLRDLLDARAAGRTDLAEKLEAIGFPGGRVPAHVLRYALISNRYTEPMNFGLDLLAQSKASVERLQGRFDRLREEAAEGGTPSPEVEAILHTHVVAFDAALDENLNMPAALAAVFELVSALNQRTLSPADARVAWQTMASIEEVLDVLDHEVRSGVVTKEEIAARLADVDKADIDRLFAAAELDGAAIVRLVVARQAARAGKDFARADAIRELLKLRGATIEDTAAGVRWKRG